MHSLASFARIELIVTRTEGEQMVKEISFIHAADLHLDSPFRGLAQTPEPIFQQIKESTFHALDRLVQTAIDKQVDFVLIVGDLFDNEKQSLKAQIRLRKAFETLQRYQINVYLSYGNHDYINGNIHPVTYPDNVCIFPNERISHFTYKKEGQEIASIYGFSYENRAVVNKKADEFQIADHSIPFHIATLHGSIQSNTEHDVYAPFQPSDLAEKDFHYWALGHIHQREIIKGNPPIVYPGNIQGRNRKETGEKGCYHVSLSETGTEMSFIPLHAIQFKALSIDVSECAEVHQIEARMLAGMNATVPELIDLTLVSDNPLLKQWERDKQVEDLIELVNETMVHQQIWTYIFRCSVQTQISDVDAELYRGDHFIGELNRHFSEASIQPFIKDLYQQKMARRHIDILTEEEELEIKSTAKNLLLNALLKE